MPKHTWSSQEDRHFNKLIDEGLTARKIQARDEIFRNLSITALQSRITKLKREKKDEINNSKEQSQSNGK